MLTMLTGSLLRDVAPFTGAWIEITPGSRTTWAAHVAPFTGAWIEILSHARDCPATRVAPFTGAWIEMADMPKRGLKTRSRSLYGSVD